MQNMLGLALAIFCVSVHSAFSYTNDFEEKNDMSFWTAGDKPRVWSCLDEAVSNGMLTVNFNGLTADEAYSGQKSLKLDLTLHNKGPEFNGVLWTGPHIEIDISKPVFVSGYLYVEDLPADIEVNLIYGISGEQSVQTLPYTVASDGWRFYYADFNEMGKAKGWRSEQPLNMNFIVQVKSRQSFHEQRVVLYLDNLRVSTQQAGEEKLVFSDDFPIDGSPEQNWTIQSGAWFIQDKMLCAGNAGGDILVCKKPVGKNVRIEYDCTCDQSDCNVQLAMPQNALQSQGGYFFGFGNEYLDVKTIRNKLMRGIEIFGEDRAHLPQKGKWHHIALEKRGASLKMLVDGECSISAYDARRQELMERGRHVEGDYFAFCVWGSTRIDNVKVYALPASEGEEANKPEQKPEVQDYEGFDKCAPDQLPKGFEAKAGVGSAARVVDVPNWIYATNSLRTTVSDKCVRLSSDGTNPAEIRHAFAPLEEGLIEMDLMADSYEGSPLRIALLDEAGTELAVIYADETGTLCMDQGNAAPVKMAYAPVHTPWRQFLREQIYIKPERWYTLRLGFRCPRRRLDVALVNYAKVPIWVWPPNKDMDSPDSLFNWMEIGSALRFQKPGKTVRAISIKATGKSSINIDNLYVYGPVRRGVVDGKDYRLPAKQLYGLNYEDRRDPITMKVNSYRYVKWLKPEGNVFNVLFSGITEDKEFVEAGIRYSELLVKQAFLAEEMQVLERILYYRSSQGGLDTKVSEKIVRLGRKVKQTEAQLNSLYQSYASAYVNSCDTNMLGQTFPDKARQLASLVEATGNEVSHAAHKFALETKANVKPLLPAAAGGSAYDYKWDKQRGCFRKGDTPAYFYIHHQCDYAFYKMLDLIGCITAYHSVNQCVTGQYGSYEHKEHYARFVKFRPDFSFAYFLPMFMHQQNTPVPAWWLEENGGDNDIFLKDKNGNPVGLPLPPGKKWSDLKGAITAHLNWWHPKVRDYFLRTAQAVVKCPPESSRIKYFVDGGEFYMSVGQCETGWNPSALQAFRIYLKDIYKTIGALNEKWAATYSSFDEITPPKDNTSAPSGVVYEFTRFRNKGYCDMVQTIKKGLRENFPDIPLAFYNGFPGGWDNKDGYDITSWFEAHDIWTDHTYDEPLWQPSNRGMDSLRKANPGKGLGWVEWSAGMVHNPQLCDEESYKANGLAMLFDSMAWGQTLHDMWNLQGGADAEMGGSWTVPQLGNSVLRYSSTFIPLTMARVRKLGRPALEYPTIQPDVGILEITSSFLNGTEVRRLMSSQNKQPALSQKLDKASWNFGYLYERYLLEGRQSLKGIQTVIIPAGYCCPPELAAKLLSWVQDGGNIIMMGPAGVYDQYGKKDNRLLKSLFGFESWTRNEKNDTWKPGGGNVAPKDTAKAIYETKYGQGTALLFCDLGKMESIVDDVSKLTRRTIASSNPDIKPVVRDGGNGIYYMYLVNINTRPLENAGEAAIELALPVNSAADMGVEPAVSVPVTVKDGKAIFKVRLAQGEGTVIRLEKRSRRFGCVGL